LEITVVGQREPFQHHQNRCEVADHSPALAASKFGDVTIFLLRQHRRAGRKSIAQSGKAKFRARPENQLFAHPRQMYAQEGDIKEGLRHKVSIAHRIH
jgi:hypothetical protein